MITPLCLTLYIAIGRWHEKVKRTKEGKRREGRKERCKVLPAFPAVSGDKSPEWTCLSVTAMFVND